MVQLWIPKEELKADLEDQAKQRLEEIEREAEKRRRQIVDGAQSKLTDERLQSAMSRFNQMVDPLIDKGRTALDGAASGIQDQSQRARELFDQAQKELQQAPVPDALQALNNPPMPGLDGMAGAQPPTPTPTPETPPPAGPMLGAPAPASPFSGMDGQAPQPMPSPAPAPPPMPEPQPVAAPAFPGLGGPPGFKPPGTDGMPGMDGLGSALADRFRGVGQGLGDGLTQGRDQAMELANKSLDVAQQALTKNPVTDAASRFGTWRDEQVAEQDRWGNVPRFPGAPNPTEFQDRFNAPSADGFKAPGIGGMGGFDPFRGATEALAPFRAQQAAADTDPQTELAFKAWEAQQGKERDVVSPDAGIVGGAAERLQGLVRGAANAWEKDRRRQEAQTETALGAGTSGEGLPQQLQAGFGAAMGPYGALPEVARGATEGATGSPLAGALAYGAASVLGPGGPRAFLQEGLPLATRLLRERGLAAQMMRAGEAAPVFKAIAAGAGVIGGGVGGVATGVQALRDGATIEEASAQAVTNAADILQISEMAGIPIDAGLKLWQALPNLPGIGKLLPKGPGLPGQLPLPDERPITPGEVTPAPEERPARGPTSEESLRGLNAPGVTTRGRPRTGGIESGLPEPAFGPLPEQPAVSYARRAQATDEAADRAADVVAQRAQQRAATPESPRPYDPNGMGVGTPLADRAGIAGRTTEGPGAVPTVAPVNPLDFAPRSQTASRGAADLTPEAAATLAGERRATDPGRAAEMSGASPPTPGAPATGPTGYTPGKDTPSGRIYDAITSGAVNTKESFRNLITEIIGRDPKRGKSEATKYLGDFPRTESGRAAPDFLFNPQHNPVVKETQDADGGTTRTLPSGLWIKLGPDGRVVGEQRIRRADDPVSYLQGALRDYGEARDPTSGLLYRDWYIDTSGVLADVARRVGGEPGTPEFKNALNNLTAAVSITTPQTEPTANIKKALYLNILYRDWQGARKEAGLERREPTWQELVDMGRTGQVVVGTKRPMAPGERITAADELPILGDYRTIKVGASKESDWQPLIPGVSADGSSRVIKENPGWVVDEILMGNQAASFVDALRTGKVEVKNGRKSPTFGLQLIGAWARKFLPWSVEDRHMHEAQGLDYEAESKSAAIYDILQGITRAHADMYPGRPMDPHQSQAALWAFEKFENAASKADNDPELALPDTVRMPDGREIKAGERAPRGTMLDMRNRLRQLTDQFARAYDGPITGESKQWLPAKKGQPAGFYQVTMKGDNLDIVNEPIPYESGAGASPFGGQPSQQVGIARVEEATRQAREQGYRVVAGAELPGITTDDAGRRYLDWLDEDHEVGADGRTVHTYSTDERKAQYVAARVGEALGEDAVGYLIPDAAGDRGVLFLGKPDGGRWTPEELQGLETTTGYKAGVTPDGARAYWSDTGTADGADIGAVRSALEENLDPGHDLIESRAFTGAVAAAERGAVLEATHPVREPRRLGESPVGFGESGRPGGEVYPSPYGSRAGAPGVKVPRRLPAPEGVVAPFPGGPYSPPVRARRGVPAAEPSGLNAPVRGYDAGAKREYIPAGLPAPARPVPPSAPEFPGAPPAAPDGAAAVRDLNVRLAQTFQEAPRLESGARVLDEEDLHAAEALQRVASDPQSNTLAQHIRTTMVGLQGRLAALRPDMAERYRNADFGGLAVGDLYYAANYHGPRVLDDPTAPNQVALNPYAIRARVDAEVGAGRITRDQAPEGFARRVVSKLVHELTHQEVWQHGGEGDDVAFADALTRNIDMLSGDMEAMTTALAARVREGGLYDAVGRQADDLLSNRRPPEEVAARAGERAGQSSRRAADLKAALSQSQPGRGEPGGTVGTGPGGEAVQLGATPDLGTGRSGYTDILGYSRRGATREPGPAVAYAAAKGEPTGEVPKRGELRGEAMGLGDLEDPENIARLLTNPPPDLTGEQINEIGRAAFKTLKKGNTPEQRAQQVEAERGRRLERRREAQGKLDTAEGHTQTVDAVADADTAARQGEITTTDADAIRGQAAKKIQTAKGEDGPPAPGEIDAEVAASRTRRGQKTPPEEKKPNEFGKARSGVTTLPAGVRAVTDKTPVKFPEREVTTRPGVAGEPAQAAERVVQPGEGADARNPLPGFEDLVPQIADIARVAEPEQSPDWIKGTAEKIPATTVEAATRGPQEGRVIEPEPTSKGVPTGDESVRRLRIPGVEGAPGGPVEGPYVANPELDVAAGQRGGVTPTEMERRSGLPPSDTGAPNGVAGTADQLPVLDPRRTQVGPLEPGQITTPLETGVRRQELPGAGPRTAPRGPTNPDDRFVGGDAWAEARARDRAAEADAARVAEATGAGITPGQQREPSPENLSLTDLMGRSANRLVDEKGNLLSKEQVVSSVLGDLTQKGGTRALLNELDTWGDGLKAVVAGAQGVRLSPGQVEDALSRMGQSIRSRGGRGSKPSWEALSKKAQEGYADWRPAHILDAMGTYMRLNLVVNPESFARNVFSTTVGVPFKLFETATGPIFERAWRAVPGFQDTSEEASHAREVIASSEGLWRSMAAGLANGMAVLRRGDPEATRTQLDISSKSAEPLKPGEKPKPSPFHETRLAERMGTLFRPLTAGDAMLKTMNEGMEAYRIAYHDAKNEFDAGKLGEDSAAIRTRMMEIMNTPTPKMLNQIQQAGEYNTFNQKAGYLATRMEALKNWDGGGSQAGAAAWRLAMNFLVPFVRISTNVMKYGAERTIPGGLASVAYGALTKKSPHEMGQRSARLLEGVLMTGALYGLDQSGVIDINGPLPEDQTERDEWQMQGRTPYSVGAGGRYFGVGNIPGLAENVAMVGLLKSARRKGEMDSAYGRESDWKRYGLDAVAQYAGQQAVRPMFGSVANAIGWATAPGDGQRKFYEDRLLRSAAGQLAPGSGTMRAIGNITDPTQRAPQGFAENVAAVYPFFRENLPARLDARGREMESEGNREWWSGVTSSTEARPDEGMPRRYLGSKSAAEDVEIGRAIDAVNAWKKDPRGNPPPTGAQRALAARYGGRENPQRKLLDQRVKQANDRLAEARRRAREDDTLPSPFAFEIPGIGA